MVADFRESLLTVEEYLNWEETQVSRYEYIEGSVYAMREGHYPIMILR